jgi:cytochrome P450/NADPH-cytochrome P450 reductase
MVNSYELQNELSDDTRFKKVVSGALNEVRRAAGDALFTCVHAACCRTFAHARRSAHLEEPNWGIARQ